MDTFEHRGETRQQIVSLKVLLPWISLIKSWIFLTSMASRPLPPPGFVAPHIRRGRYIFLEAAGRRPLALVCAGYEECGPDFVVDRPSFPWHAVEILESGSWEVRRSGRWVAAGAGTIVSYGPGQAGGIRAAGRGPHGKYFADFRGTAARRELQAAGLATRRVRHLADWRPAADLYEQLLSCAALPPEAQTEVTAAVLHALLVRLGAQPDTTPRPAAQRRLVFERCRDYLAAHYASVPGPGAAARACRVGPEYFSRLFREHTGQTPSQFLARLRMHHAARLLQQSDLTVKAVGRAVGFEDPYHFSRVFKQIHGAAPRDFKRGGGPSLRKRK
jgi:AraC-like DNA-binding protein